MDILSAHGRLSAIAKAFVVKPHGQGWGREMGYEAIELYTETKAVAARL